MFTLVCLMNNPNSACAKSWKHDGVIEHLFIFIIPSHYCHRVAVLLLSYHRHHIVISSSSSLYHRHHTIIIAPSHFHSIDQDLDGAILNYMALSGFHSINVFVIVPMCVEKTYAFLFYRHFKDRQPMGIHQTHKITTRQ